MKGQRGYARGSRQPERLGWMRMLWQRVARWQELVHERALIARLSDEALKDLGLSRADVARETGRPFWDDPLGKGR